MPKRPKQENENLPEQRDDLELHKLDDEALLFDPLTSNTHRLNNTALEIWKQCDGTHKAADIAARLTELFEVSLADSQLHVDRMLHELRSLHLLVSEEAAINRILFEST